MHWIWQPMALLNTHRTVSGAKIIFPQSCSLEWSHHLDLWLEFFHKTHSKIVALLRIPEPIIETLFQNTAAPALMPSAYDNVGCT